MDSGPVLEKIINSVSSSGIQTQFWFWFQVTWFETDG
jgi:hypothetical protein